MAVEKQINVVISAVDKYSGGMAAFGGSIGTIAKLAVGAELALIAMSAAAAKLGYELGTTVFESATDFHDAIFDVTAVAQSFGTSADDISEVLDQMVAKFPVTGKVAGETLQIIAQLGYGAKDQLIAVADAATTLSIATGVDVRTAAEATLSTMNAFGDSIQNAEQVMNVFAAVAFTSAANVSDLREAMKFAGPAAKLASISFEETAGTLGLLKNLGLEASQSGTVFRMAMSKLLDVTPKAAAALAHYGLTADDINPKFNSLSDIIGKFGGKAIEADHAIAIFGVRAAGISLVINEGQAAFDEYVKSITGTTAAVDAMASKMQKWSVTVEMIEGDMDLLKKTIGIDLVSALVSFVGTSEDEGLRGFVKQLRLLEEAHGEVGGPLVQTFQNLVALGKNVFKDIFGDVEGFYKWLALISDALGKNVEVLGIWIGEFFKGFVSITDSASALRTMLQAVNVSIGMLALPIALVHDMFVDLWELIKKGIEAVDWAWSSWNAGVLMGMKEIYKAMDALPFVDMGDTISSLESQISDWQSRMENAFSPLQLGDWTGAVVDGFSKATTAVSELGDETDKLAGKNVDAAEAAAQGATDWSMALENMSEGYEVIDGQIVKVKEDVIDWGQEMAGTGIIVDKTAEGAAKLADAQKQVTEEAKKTKAALTELEKHELKLEAAKFMSDLKLAEIELTKTFDLLEKEMELEVKLDIEKLKAGVEIIKAQAKTTQAAFDSIAESIGAISSETSKAIDAFAGIGAGLKDIGKRKFIQDVIEAQLAQQEKLIDAQVDLTKAEAEMTKERADRQRIENERAREGDMNPIQVDIIGVTEPWLKGLMQSLFDEIMVKAQAEAFSCMCQ